VVSLWRIGGELWCFEGRFSGVGNFPLFLNLFLENAVDSRVLGLEGDERRTSAAKAALQKLLTARLKPCP
jgi:hypothetical protein